MNRLSLLLLFAANVIVMISPCNGAAHNQTLTIPGFVTDDTIMVNPHKVFRFIGYSISWNPDTDIIRFSGDEGRLLLTVGDRKVRYTGGETTEKTIPLSAPVKYYGRLLHGPLTDLLKAARIQFQKERHDRRVQYQIGDGNINVRLLSKIDKPVVDLAYGSVVKLKTNRGPIYLGLFDKKAPITAGNFLELAGDGFYDGLTFHRVIPNFMIQGGCPEGDGTGGPGFTIPDETDTGLKHYRGSLSMAKTSQPHTAGSQFFICHTRCQHLDGDYSVFGHCLGGMKVVDAIQEGDTISDAIVLWQSRHADDAITAAREARVPTGKAD